MENRMKATASRLSRRVAILESGTGSDSCGMRQRGVGSLPDSTAIQLRIHIGKLKLWACTRIYRSKHNVARSAYYMPKCQS